MTLQQRIEILVQLGAYMQNNSQQWQDVKSQANLINPWFVPEFIELASENIISSFLPKNNLEHWVRKYNIPQNNNKAITAGIVMAGNIPMAGFHDMLCAFITGHRQLIKLSSKDSVLIPHLVAIMTGWQPKVAEHISFAENLKGCQAYIATGSNNSSRYFEYYFGKFSNIIRKNRTSVAVIEGTETDEELQNLAEDMQSYFGLGCRNVTKLYVPLNYNFEKLLQALNKYQYYENFHKYKHNYDYQLALLMMGNKFYMTNGTVLLSENTSVFTAVSQVNYEYYIGKFDLKTLKNNADIQCVIGHAAIPFGKAQKPALTDYADGVDTVEFFTSL